MAQDKQDIHDEIVLKLIDVHINPSWTEKDEALKYLEELKTEIEQRINTIKAT